MRAWSSRVARTRSLLQLDPFASAQSWHQGAGIMRSYLFASASVCVVASVVASALPVAAQVYPTKQIELIVPFVAGGTTDNIARMIAQRFTESWGQTVIVSSRPGAGSVIGTAAVAKAPPDGHTLLVTTLAFAVT